MNVRDLQFEPGARVLVRVDFNVPLSNGAVADDTRIRRAMPTIEHLISRGAKVVLISHLGRPKGKVVPSLSLLPAASHLAGLLDREVIFAHSVAGDHVEQLSRELAQGGILMAENLRFEPGEKKNNIELARKLAALGDVFVNDAFGVMHRQHASVTGIPKLLPSAYGLLVEEEIKALGGLLDSSTRHERAPFAAILGGAKVSDKIAVIDSLSKQIDHLFIGGAMAYTFLAASGVPVGSSRVEADKFELALRLLTRCANRGVKVHLPVDHIVAAEFAESAPSKIVSEIPEGEMALDIGPKTLAKWTEVLSNAQTVFWNGPLGVFEWDAFSGGTKGIAETLAASSAFTVVGGGDSAAAIAKFNLTEAIDHISTGGGASLDFLEDGKLVGLSSLGGQE